MRSTMQIIYGRSEHKIELSKFNLFTKVLCLSTQEIYLAEIHFGFRFLGVKLDTFLALYSPFSVTTESAKGCHRD